MIATPHRTRPVEVLITEPLTTANRGEIARWLEDQGVAVGVPAFAGDAHPAAAWLVLDGRSCRRGEHGVALGERVVVDGRTVDVVDQAHYKLWYEPVERTEP